MTIFHQTLVTFTVPKPKVNHYLLILLSLALKEDKVNTFNSNMQAVVCLNKKRIVNPVCWLELYLL